MKTRTALILILAAVIAGGMLRGWGLRYGLPLDLRPDEHYYREAARGFDAGRLRPPHDAYPGLAWWSSYAALKTGHAVDQIVGPARPFAAFLDDHRASHTALRSWSWLTGTLTIAFAAWLSFRLRGAAAAAATAWLLAVAFLPVRDAHAGTLDVPAALITLCAVIAIDRVAELLTFRRAVTAGTLVGAAAAWRYSPGILALPLAAAVLLSSPRPSWKTRVTSLLLAAMAACTVIVVAMPYAWRDFTEFSKNLKMQAGFSALIDVNILTRCLWMFGTGLDASLGVGLAVSGVLVIAMRPGLDKTRGVLFSLCTLVLLLPVASIPLSFFRYLEASLPLLCVAAGIGVAHFVQYVEVRVPSRRAAAFAVATIGIGFDPLWRSVELARLYATTTTSEQLASWFATNAQGLKITSPADRGLEGIPQDRQLRFEPSAWPRTESFLIALSRGGNGVTDWITPAGAVLDIDPSCKKVATFVGFRPGTHQLVGFEALDRTDYPWRELDLLIRPGPDIAVWRVDPKIAGINPPPPVIEFDPDIGRGRVSIASRSRHWPLGYTLTVDREPPIPGVAALSGITLSPAAPWMDVPSTFPKGRYTVTARTVTANSESPPSDHVTIDVR